MDSFDSTVVDTRQATTPPADQEVFPPNGSQPYLAVRDTGSLTVEWGTDVFSSTVLRYGLSPTLGVFSVATGDSGTVHTATAVGLVSNTIYYCEAASANSAGEWVSQILEFKTAKRVDTTAPEFTVDAVPEGILQDRFTVVATTDDASDTRLVVTGPDNAVFEVFDPGLVFDHQATVTGPLPATSYTALMEVTNAVGLTSSQQITVITADAPDETPPVNTPVAVTERTQTSLTVGWESNEFANSIVEYTEGGPLALTKLAVGDEQTVILPDYVPAQAPHKVVLTNLNPLTVYHIRAWSEDLSGNVSEISGTTAPTTGEEDLTAPQISGITVASVDNEGFTITFFTNEDAVGQVEVGVLEGDLDEVFGNPTVSGSEHRVDVTGRESGTTYYYRALATDLSGNGPSFNPEGVLMVTTDLEADTKSAEIVATVVRDLTETSATIEVTTDELANFLLEYAVAGVLPPATKPAASKQADGVQTVFRPDFVRLRSERVTGLASNTAYDFRVWVQDKNNPPTFEEGDFTTASAPPPPPQIQAGPTVLSVTPNSVTISVTTNVSTNSLLEGGEGNYVGFRRERSELRPVNNLTATGFVPNTTYIYRITLRDASGKAVTTDPGALAADDLRVQRMDLSFTTPPEPDDDPPNHSNLIANISGGNVEISVITDEPATTTFIYGRVGEFGVPGVERRQLQEEPGLTFPHTARLTGLDLGERFLFRVQSVDGNGNSSVALPSFRQTKPATKLQPPGGDGSFVTDTQSDTQLPAILSGPTMELSTANELVIGLGTDETTTSRVDYTPVAGPGVAKAAQQGTPTLRAESSKSTRSHRIILNNLSPSTRYTYTVTALDLSGNNVISDPAFATTTDEVDATAPQIVSDPRLIYKTDRSVTITWDLDEIGDGVVRYGTGGELNFTQSALENSKSPVVTLTNLDPATVYTYQVASRDLNKNGPVQSELLVLQTDPLPDTTPPTIERELEPTALTDNSATLRWTTDESSDSAVKFGPGASLDFVSGSAEDDTFHVVTLTNLLRNTTYSYQVESTDRSDNGPTLGTVLTFQTAATGDTTSPAIPGGLEALVGGTGALLTWEPNQEADLVGYNIFRGVGQSALELITTRVEDTEYRDSGLSSGTVYRYAILAVDRFSNQSGLTSPLEVVPNRGNVPQAPGHRTQQGPWLNPVLAVRNVSARAGREVTYEFQVSSRADFSDIVTSVSGVSEGSGTDEPGITAWQVDRPPQEGIRYYWRARANDGLFNGLFMEPTNFAAADFVAGSERPPHPGDINGDLVVNFPDFVRFAWSFGWKKGDERYEAGADLNGDGQVNFPDFVGFARAFGTQYLRFGNAATSKAVAAHIVPADRQTSWALRTASRALRPGADLTVQITVEGAAALAGYGLAVTYDESRLAFLDVAESDSSLLVSDGRETALFGVLDWTCPVSVGTLSLGRKEIHYAANTSTLST